MFSLVVFICFYSFGFYFDCISQAGVTDQAHMKLGFKMSALDSFSQAFFFSTLPSSIRVFVASTKEEVFSLQRWLCSSGDRCPDR